MGALLGELEGGGLLYWGPCRSWK